MPTMQDSADRQRILARLNRLTPESTARWGKMDVIGMLAHLNQAAQMGLGELPVTMKERPTIVRVVLKYLILYVIPFPKGAPTARELLAGDRHELTAALTTLRAAIDRIAALPPDQMGPAHPIFGPLTRKEWGVLGYRHYDHHLKQFGV